MRELQARLASVAVLPPVSLLLCVLRAFSVTGCGLRVCVCLALGVRVLPHTGVGAGARPRAAAMTDGGGGGKLDRWLSRQKDKQAAAAAASEPGAAALAPGQPQCNGAAAAGAAEARIPSTPPSAGKPPSGAGARATRGSGGGVGACCNLIRLLDPDELVKVHEVLVGAMREKKVAVPALPGDLVAAAGSAPAPGGPQGAAPPPANDCAFQRSPMVLSATAGESIAMLTQVLEEARKLGSEAVQHVRKRSAGAAAGNPGGESLGAAVASQGGDGGEDGAPAPNAKMSRWLSKVNKNRQAAEATGPPGGAAAANAAAQEHAAPAAADAAPSGKLGRWIKRANTHNSSSSQANGSPAQQPAAAPSTDAAATASAPDAAAAVAAAAAAAPADETPVAFVKRACDAVRASWACGAGRNMSLAEEWEKLKLERASLDALISMVTAVKETPEKVVSQEGAAPLTPAPNGISSLSLILIHSLSLSLKRAPRH